MILSVRKAVPNDVSAVYELFRQAIRVMNNNNIPQWDEIYPNKDDIYQDIQKNEMYLCEIEKKIASVFVLNTEYDEQYNNGRWKYPHFMVLHRLCVNPDFQHQGIAKRTLAAAEKIAGQNMAQSIRLDVFSLNPIALHLYQSCGYIKTGVVSFRKGIFWLYEKPLEPTAEEPQQPEC